MVKSKKCNRRVAGVEKKKKTKEAARSWLEWSIRVGGGWTAATGKGEMKRKERTRQKLI
jgi:hypothetical protein